jgi:hypothetical protein
MLFGGLVAGAHGVVLIHSTRPTWLRTLLVAGAVAVVGGMAGRSMLDERHAWTARRIYSDACRTYDFASHVLAPDRLEGRRRTADRITFEQGRWFPLPTGFGLHGRYSAMFVNDVRTLVAEDKALVPLRPWHRLGVPQTVTAQCLLTHRAPEAVQLRRAGLIRPFRFADVEVR